MINENIQINQIQEILIKVLVEWDMVGSKEWIKNEN